MPARSNHFIALDPDAHASGRVGFFPFGSDVIAHSVNMFDDNGISAGDDCAGADADGSHVASFDRSPTHPKVSASDTLFVRFLIDAEFLAAPGALPVQIAMVSRQPAGSIRCESNLFPAVEWPLSQQEPAQRGEGPQAMLDVSGAWIEDTKEAYIKAIKSGSIFDYIPAPVTTAR